jgi:hypothetical protein
LVRIEAIENELMTVTIVKREPNKQRKTKEKIGEALGATQGAIALRPNGFK